MKALQRGILAVSLCCLTGLSQEKKSGVRGDPEAIAEAQAMVETLGGQEIWSQMKHVHFIHRWYFWNRADSYLENEILDLTGPRSWVEMKSEIYHRLRAYSPEHRYWNVVNGEFSYASDEQYSATQERAPFHWVRIARGVAVGDPYYEVRFGKGEFENSRQLEFYGPDGRLGGYILLNAKKEPLVWGTTQYKYTFGPMETYGNLRAPLWGSTGNGAVTYLMVSLKGDNQPADPALFVPANEKGSPKKKGACL